MATRGSGGANRPGRGRAPREVPALGSMSNPSSSEDETGRLCVQCGAPTTTRIRLALPDGRPALFVSCEACERTSWYALDGDGTPQTRAEILGTSEH